MISAAVLKVGASLAALFLFGGVCGFAVANRRMANPAIRAQLEERWIEARRRDDAQRLKLTTAQVEDVRATYQDLRGDIRAVRDSAAAGLVEAARKQGRAMWPMLTAEQQNEFLRLAEERAAQLRKRSST